MKPATRGETYTNEDATNRAIHSLRAVAFTARYPASTERSVHP